MMKFDNKPLWHAICSSSYNHNLHLLTMEDQIQTQHISITRVLLRFIVPTMQLFSEVHN